MLIEKIIKVFQKLLIYSSLLVLNKATYAQIVSNVSRESDSLALVALYEATDGDNWNKNTRWLSKLYSIDNWYGVKLQNGRVVEINLPDNNLSGFLPTEMVNLTELTTLNLQNNSIVSCPYGDCTIDLLQYLSKLSVVNLSNNKLNFVPYLADLPNLIALDVRNNLLSYKDFEMNVSLGEKFVYWPQPDTIIDNVIRILAGETISLQSSIIGSSNQYNWYKDNIQLFDGGTISGSETSKLVFSKTSTNDNGTYYCKVTNNRFPELTMVSKLNVNVNTYCNIQDSLALVNLYKSLEYARLGNWLQAGKNVWTWDGVEMTGDRVTGLNLSGRGIIGSPVIADLSELRYLILSRLFKEHIDYNAYESEVLQVLNNMRQNAEINCFWEFLYGNDQGTGNFRSYSNIKSLNASNLPKLVILDISYNSEFSNLPISISSFPLLEVLDAANCNITELPADFNQLQNLRILYLDKSKFADFPISITELSKLEVLSFEGENGNMISNLPIEFAKLSKLKYLNLRNNALTVLPDIFNSFINLELLDVSSNSLKTFPLSIGNLSALKYFIASENLIIYPQIEFTKFALMKFIDLSANNLIALPPGFENMVLLEKAFLHNNQITSLPENIGNLNNLSELHLMNNLITYIPESLWNLTELKTLGLSSNLIESISENISNLNKLEELGLCNNKIKVLPNGIYQLTNLNKLWLESNYLENLSTSEISWNLLTQLSLSRNKFVSIPQSIQKLVNLEYLFFSFNQLSGSLSWDKSYLSSLKQLSLEWNNLTVLPDFKSFYDDLVLNIKNNRLGFENILLNIEFSKGFTSNNLYSPQQYKQKPKSHYIVKGTPITLSPNLPETDGNVYAWYKSGIYLSNTRVLEIPNSDITDIGLYQCSITNSMVPDLILYSDKTDVQVAGNNSLSFGGTEKPFVVIDQNGNLFLNSSELKIGQPASNVSSSFIFQHENKTNRFIFSTDTTFVASNLLPNSSNELLTKSASNNLIIKNIANETVARFDFEAAELITKGNIEISSDYWEPMGMMYGNEYYGWINKIEYSNNSYFIGAFNESAEDLLPNHILQYHSEYKQWERLSNLPGLSGLLSNLFILSDELYVVSGWSFDKNSFNTIENKEVWSYNLISKTWKQLTNYPGAMPIGGSSFVLNSNAYVFSGGGFNELVFNNEVWMYLPETDTWQRKNDFPAQLHSMFTTVLNGAAYACFGIGEDDKSNKIIWQYNATADAWELITQLPATSSSQIWGFSLQNKIYAINQTESNETQLWQFDTEKRTWQQLANLPFEPVDVFTVGGKAYIYDLDYKLFEYKPKY